MRIRKLTTLDVIKVANLLKDDILVLAQKAKEHKVSDGDYTKFGVEIVSMLLEKIEKGESELFKWFVSLTEMSYEEFLNAPPSAILDLIEQLATNEELKDFFVKAQRLAQRLGNKTFGE